MSVNELGVRDVLAQGPVIPVIVIDDVSQAVPLARALVEGGIRVLEVTLRTPAGIHAIAAMRQAVPEAIVGAGTVLSEGQLRSVRDAGGQFVVTPGFSANLCRLGASLAMPMLPGVVTATEIMGALELGLETLKFFPAARSGGVALLKDFASVFGQVRFCPTGGIDVKSAPDYLALPNVLCVGMSSIAPLQAIRDGDFASITARAREATALRR